MLMWFSKDWDLFWKTFRNLTNLQMPFTKKSAHQKLIWILLTPKKEYITADGK